VLLEELFICRNCFRIQTKKEMRRTGSKENKAEKYQCGNCNCTVLNKMEE